MKLEGATALVTGGTGFIGRRLVAALRKIDDLRLLLVSRRDPQLKVRGQWIEGSLEELTPDTWQSIGVDKIDVVFHLGAFIPKSSTRANDVEPCYRSNLEGTRRLLESLPASIGSIVFASTVDVYGAAGDDSPISEESPVAPLSIYGASKVFGEQMIRDYAEHADIRSAILRIGHVYGPGEEEFAKLIPTVIQRVLSGRPPLIYGTGEELRDFLFVDDAAEAILRSARAPEKHIGPLNVVSGQSTSIRQIVQMIIDLSGYGGTIDQRETDSVGRSLRCDAGMMRRVLGEWPLVDLQTGLSLEINHWKENQQHEE